MSESHTNRLSRETSPYLLQHQHNPVDWHAWDDEAIARAKREDKPILLSIGYSACHWCHVMERESFENEEIAELMNRYFVNIKVDREERPDIDQIYMNAVQMLTGHGGWPLTVFLTPDLVPFYGGTYFPPQDSRGMPGFPRVLEAINAAYRERPEEISESAQSILDNLASMNQTPQSKESLSVKMLDAATEGIKRGYDAEFGGFGDAPKFPAPMNLEFLLRSYKRTGDAEALEIVTNTCRRMAEGGIYDQLGGGFHRYSTDREWLAPHFEKMLYDNAQLAVTYLHVYQATNEDFFRTICVETLDYVVREMTDARGGFYSTQDADSEGVEGKFFVWSPEEVREILGAEDARLFNHYYDVTDAGNFEGHNILRVLRSFEEAARELKVPVERLKEAVARGRRELFERREKRVKPGRDEKVLTSWNGLMLAAFAEAGAALGRQDYLDVATNNAEFVLSELRRNDLLLHSYKDERARFNAYLDDYSYYANGLITLYETTGNLRWLREAVTLTDKMIAEFWDTEAGGFFYTGASHEQLIVRTKDYFDNATPSGNSVALEVLLRLAKLTDKEDYERKAVALLRNLRAYITRHPSAFGRALGALDFHLSKTFEIALVGDFESKDLQTLRDEVWRAFLPNKIVAYADGSSVEASQLIPLLRERTRLNDRATAYVCENYTCQRPVTTPVDLRAQLES